MKRIAFLILSCCAITPLAFAQSSGNAAAGKTLANEYQCTVCHGPDGNGNQGSVRFRLGDVPRISAQPQTYFIKSMNDYKSGKRAYDDMQTMAEQLSDRQIRDLAAWYGSQKPSAVATYYLNPND